MIKQPTFTDTLLFSNKKLRRSKAHYKLQQIKTLIDWSEIEKLFVEFDKTKSGKGGRPPIEMSVKIKMLFLQHMYNISDENLEEFILPNLDYQEFIGLLISDGVPDFTTFWRFKDMITKNNLTDKIWETINNQLLKKDIKLERGKISIIDATIIQSSTKPLSDEKREELKTSPNNQIDTDAHSTAKNGKKYFGYKGHINVDAETKLIQKQSFTSANVHDINEFEKLLTGKEEEVHGDKAYQSKEFKRKARLVKVKYNVLRRGNRNRPLSEEDKLFNKTQSKVRARVEHVFGAIKKYYGFVKCRAKTKIRNELTWVMNCVIHNVCRTNYLLSKVS